MYRSHRHRNEPLNYLNMIFHPTYEIPYWYLTQITMCCDKEIPESKQTWTSLTSPVFATEWIEMGLCRMSEWVNEWMMANISCPNTRCARHVQCLLNNYTTWSKNLGNVMVCWWLWVQWNLWTTEPFVRWSAPWRHLPPFRVWRVDPLFIFGYMWMPYFYLVWVANWRSCYNSLHSTTCKHCWFKSTQLGYSLVSCLVLHVVGSVHVRVCTASYTHALTRDHYLYGRGGLELAWSR